MDLKRLEIVQNSEFNIVIRPDEIEEPNYINDHIQTINFHSKNRNLPVEDIVASWKKGSQEKVAFQRFDEYVKLYSTGLEPVVGGQNVRGYDLPIYNRCIKKYNLPYRFYRREEFELLDFFSHWFLYARNPPPNHKLDTMRKKFGMSLDGAHDALVDVKDTANIIIRFLKLHQQFIKRVSMLNG